MIKNHLHLAAYDGQEDVVKTLLKQGEKKKTINAKDKNGWTPLHCAAARGHLKVCKQLIDAGADVTVKNLDGATALHYLARITNPENAKQYVELLKLLLRKGAAVNEVNRHNETPLHQAAMKGATHAVEFLVTNKAEANMQNEFGETALHYAVRLGAVKCIELLLAANADVFLEGEREEGSALTLAEVTGQAEILGMMKRSSSYVDHVKKYGDRSLKNTLRGDSSASARAAEQSALAASAPLVARPVSVPPPGLAGITGARASSSSVAAAVAAAASAAPSGSSSSTIGNVAFGIARGACRQQGCECAGYRWDAANGDGGPCLNCGDFPTQHRRVDAGPEAAAAGATERAAEDARRLETALGGAVADLSHSWSIDSAEVKIEALLGEGTAAKVYKGKYRGQAVAVKVLKESLDPTQLADFAKEFQIYSDLRSPHVVLFFGACLRDELCMVFELCTRGSLFDVLNSDEDLEWSRVLKLSIDIAKALNTLHSWVPSIVHRDLKSLNLLVDSNWTCKVSDFGLSRFTSGSASNLSTLGKLRGTYAYSAPEVYFGDPFTTKADCYSVGIIFWELAHRSLTGEYAMPYSEYQELVFDFQIIIQVAKNQRRPTIPAACPADYRELITALWSQTAAARPEIADVLARLEEMAARQKLTPKSS